MKCLRLIFLLLFFFRINHSEAQQILQNKLEACTPSEFCIDCGNPKASVDEGKFKALLSKLENDKGLNLKGKSFNFQMYIDSLASACTLSYDGGITPLQASQISEMLRQFKGWKSAIENGRPVSASILVAFDFTRVAKGEVRHELDLGEAENIYSEGTPEILNTKYKYENKNLKDYAFTVWKKQNSMLPYDMTNAISVDKNDVVWLGTGNGLVRFYNNKMEVYKKNNAIFKAKDELNIAAVATDTKNNKWFSANQKIYKYDDTAWEIFDSKKTGIKNAYGIFTSKDGRVFFASFEGLGIYENGKWQLLTTKILPSLGVFYANSDSKGRIWIGTDTGTIILNKNGSIVKLNESKSPLKNLCVTDMVEDKDGNIWFATFAYDKKTNEKLVELSSNGSWSYFDMNNSGLPQDDINKMLYDKKEDVLWISVNNVGLVRFDRKNDWQVFTNQNSGVPSTIIDDLQQDSKGNIWCATHYGLLRVTKKNQ